MEIVINGVTYVPKSMGVKEHDFGDGRGPVPASTHPNGGWLGS